MTSAVPGHFVNLARRFGVDEADLLLLERAGVLCAQDMFYKFLDDAAREKLISTMIKPYKGARDPETGEPVLRERELNEEESEGIPSPHKGTWFLLHSLRVRGLTRGMSVSMHKPSIKDSLSYHLF